MVRLAQVLPWSGVSKVSPCTNSMRFIGTSSSSATIWRRAVVMPVPRSTLPEKTVTLPVLSMARKESTSVRASGLADPCACEPVDEPANAKLTTRAPEPSRASRREIWMFMCASLSRRALDGAHDAGMGAAAAKIVGQRVLDGGFGRLLVFGEESRRLHDHSVDAVAALRG